MQPTITMVDDLIDIGTLFLAFSGRGDVECIDYLQASSISV